MKYSSFGGWKWDLPTDRFYVYVIKNIDEKLYVGQTRNADLRLQRHNNGTTPQTKKGRPWDIVYLEKCATREIAVNREKEIKKLSNHELLILINNQRLDEVNEPIIEPQRQSSNNDLCEADWEDFWLLLDATQIEVLTNREGQIFGLRYGLIDGKYHTLAEIGEQFGLSRERIRQLLLRANRKIISNSKRQAKAKNSSSLNCKEFAKYLLYLIRPATNDSFTRLDQFFENSLTSLPVNHAYHISEIAAKIAYDKWEIAFAHLTDRYNKALERERKSKILERSDLLIKNLLKDVIWSKQFEKFKPNLKAILKPERHVNSNGEGKSGTFYSLKMKRLVEYESLLELRFMKRLESTNLIYQYLEQPIKIEYEVDNKKYWYFPDILLTLNDKRCVIVEIKPIWLMALHQNLSKWHALRQVCEKNGFGILITDGNHTLQEVMRYEPNEQYCERIASVLKQKPIYWEEYKKIKEIYNPKQSDFTSMILRNKYEWSFSPFKLVHPNFVS